MRPHLLILISLSICLSLGGQNEIINPSGRTESWTPRVKVSAVDDLGVMSSLSEGKISPEKFYVRIPSIHPDSLCVEVRSADGRYEGLYSFPIKGLSAGYQAFSWETEYSKELATFRANRVALLATIADQCKALDQPYVLAAYEVPKDTSVVHFFINGTSNTKVKLFPSDPDRRQTIDCAYENSGEMRAYNCHCIIPIDSLRRSPTIAISTGKPSLERISRYASRKPKDRLVTIKID